MDQIKIGRFIAELRKEKNLTQRQLADSMNLSDKTISKWECGKGLPEVSLMLPLCEILEITVNELLCGERIEKEVYEEKAEETLVTLVDEKEKHRQSLHNTLRIASLYLIWDLTPQILDFLNIPYVFLCGLFILMSVLAFGGSIHMYHKKDIGKTEFFLTIAASIVFFVVFTVLLFFAHALG